MNRLRRENPKRSKKRTKSLSGGSRLFMRCCLLLLTISATKSLALVVGLMFSLYSQYITSGKICQEKIFVNTWQKIRDRKTKLLSIHHPLVAIATPYLSEKAFRAIHLPIAHFAKQFELSALLILLLLVFVLVVLLLILVLVVLVILIILLVLVLILVILHFDLRSPPNEIIQPQSAEHRLFYSLYQATLLL